MNTPFRILIIEDNPIDAEIMERLLRKSFPQAAFDIVINATSLVNGLVKFAPDIILSDNALPQFNAAEALTLVKEHVAHTPFILVTGTVSEEYAAEMIRNGADDYILKDRMARLPAAIESAIAKRKAEREKEEFVQLLAQSQENLQTIFDNTSEGFILLDPAFRIKTFNNRAKEGLFYYINQNITIGQHIMEFVEESRRHFFENVLRRVQLGEIVEYERAVKNRLQKTSWIHFSFNPAIKDGEMKGICITGRDITRRKESEELLKESFKANQSLIKRISAILNTLPANIGLLDQDGVIVDVNDSWKGFADENGFIGNDYGIGQNYLTIAQAASNKDVLPDGRIVAEGIRQVLAHLQPEFVYEYACDSPNEKRWFRMIVTPLSGQAYQGAVVMHIDISEIKRLEKERLESKMNEQKSLTRAILKAQEKERHAIAIELHDNVNQILVGTNLLLSHARTNTGDMKKTLTVAIENLQQAITENRKIAHEFVAPNLESDSLTEQLNRLFEKMLAPSGAIVAVYPECFNEELLDSERKLNVYRIAQEQCTNIVKYAKATMVSITLATTEEFCDISISDNGIGADQKIKSSGIGLTNINHRLNLFNGTAKIVSSPGNGFTLMIRLPLKT